MTLTELMILQAGGITAGGLAAGSIQNKQPADSAKSILYHMAGALPGMAAASSFVERVPDKYQIPFIVGGGLIGGLSGSLAKQVIDNSKVSSYTIHVDPYDVVRATAITAPLAYGLYDSTNNKDFDPGKSLAIGAAGGAFTAHQLTNVYSLTTTPNLASSKSLAYAALLGAAGGAGMNAYRDKTSQILPCLIEAAGK